MKRGTVESPSAAPRTLGGAVASALFALYKGIVSPLLVWAIGPACRFEPTCSEYAAQAVSTHGIVPGGWMTVRRLLRCRPGGGWGYDPVTDNNSRD